MTDEDRFNYPALTPESVVFDCGAYHGGWSRRIYDKYKCRIFAFEPIKEFADIIKGECPKEIQVIQAGVGASNRTEMFGVQNDSTGLFAGSKSLEPVKIISLPDAIDSWDKIGLLKLNIEGMEHECLDALIETGVIQKVQNLQVQFHPNVPLAVFSRDRIRRDLAETHECVWCEDWVWEGWKLK